VDEKKPPSHGKKKMRKLSMETYLSIPFPRPLIFISLIKVSFQILCFVYTYVFLFSAGASGAEGEASEAEVEGGDDDDEKDETPDSLISRAPSSLPGCSTLSHYLHLDSFFPVSFKVVKFERASSS